MFKVGQIIRHKYSDIIAMVTFVTVSGGSNIVYLQNTSSRGGITFLSSKDLMNWYLVPSIIRVELQNSEEQTFVVGDVVRLVIPEIRRNEEYAEVRGVVLEVVSYDPLNVRYVVMFTHGKNHKGLRGTYRPYEIVLSE